VVRIKLIPDPKNKMPRTPKMIRDLMSRVPPLVFVKTIAPYIKPAIPNSVSIAPKILFTFIFLFDFGFSRISSQVCKNIPLICYTIEFQSCKIPTFWSQIIGQEEKKIAFRMASWGFVLYLQAEFTAI